MYDLTAISSVVSSSSFDSMTSVLSRNLCWSICGFTYWSVPMFFISSILVIGVSRLKFAYLHGPYVDVILPSCSFHFANTILIVFHAAEVIS